MTIAAISLSVLDASGTTHTIGTLPIGQQLSSGSASIVLATDALAEPGGAAVSGVSMPLGGVGLTGWSSAIFSTISGTLKIQGVAGGVAVPISGVTNQTSATAGFVQPMTGALWTLGAAANTTIGNVNQTSATAGFIQPMTGATFATTETYANILTGQNSAIGTSATSIVAARPGRKGVMITNLGTIDVFYGATGVSATSGDLLIGTRGASKFIDGAAALYGVVASGTGSLSFAEIF